MMQVRAPSRIPPGADQPFLVTRFLGVRPLILSAMAVNRFVSIRPPPPFLSCSDLTDGAQMALFTLPRMCAM